MTRDIFINRLHFPVTALGPGRRIGIWFQGCSIHCPGCLSRDTWDFGRGRVPLEDVAGSLANWLPEADGITITGGEPFDQPGALETLLHWIRQEASFAGNILAFSGYPASELQRRFPDLLARLDAVVAGPYDEGFPQSLPLRGSGNQELVLLSATARERFEPWLATQRDVPPQLDIMWDGREFWMAGIPRRGDLPRLRQALAQHGFESRTSDQQAPSDG